MHLVRVAVLAFVIAALPLAARAEVLAIPFIGGAFQGQTTLPLFTDLPLPPAATAVNLSRSLVIGGAGMWLTSGIVGAEAELAHSPRFFKASQTFLTLPDSVTTESETTLSGNLVLTFPRAVTRDSLRPYVVGGIGVAHVGVNDVANFSTNTLDRNLMVFTIGGGAIGYLGQHSGVRFDLRRIRSVRDEQPTGVRLSYWRATVGVTFRY
jgi:hypothetical protein